MIGAGGLGAPLLLYLAASGIGHLTIVDHDVVDISNLQRQVIHTEAFIGQPKAQSARAACLAVNSSISIDAIVAPFTHNNAMDLVGSHDVVIDATDNVATRYLINDASILLGRAVVSGAALRTEGQLAIYGCQGGPCYRCLYPTPPPASTVTNCSDGGVLGIIPGIIGCLQALEVLRLLNDLPDTVIERSRRSSSSSTPTSSTSSSLPFIPPRPRLTSSMYRQMLLLDGSATTRIPVDPPAPTASSTSSSTSSSSSRRALSSGLLRTVPLRPRNPECAVCGEHPTITSIDHSNVIAPLCAESAAAISSHKASSSSSPTTTTSSPSTSSIDNPSTSTSTTTPTASVPLHGTDTVLKPSDDASSFTATTCKDKANEASTARSSSQSRSIVTKVGHLSPTTFASMHDQPHVLLDVREDVQHRICSLPNSVNIPLRQLKKKYSDVLSLAHKQAEKVFQAGSLPSEASPITIPVVVVCRRGLDSIVATNLLQQLEVESTTTTQSSGSDTASSVQIRLLPRNLEGGLVAYKRDIDPSFPLY